MGGAGPGTVHVQDVLLIGQDLCVETVELFAETDVLSY
jgi:hypothetical protein